MGERSNEPGFSRSQVFAKSTLSLGKRWRFFVLIIFEVMDFDLVCAIRNLFRQSERRGLRRNPGFVPGCPIPYLHFSLVQFDETGEFQLRTMVVKDIEPEHFEVRRLFK